MPIDVARICNARLPAILLLLSAPLLAIADPPASQPITAEKSQLGQLLRTWYAEGSAAGNIGDIQRDHRQVPR